MKNDLLIFHRPLLIACAYLSFGYLSDFPAAGKYQEEHSGHGGHQAARPEDNAVTCAGDRDLLIIVLQNEGDRAVLLQFGCLGLREAQRVAIARALLSDAPILLLDEATSALDEQTEAKLLSNIDAMREKTVIIVTHRRAALAICDYQLHLENGHLSRKEAMEP